MLDAARSSAVGGDAKWDAQLRALSLEPWPAEKRREYLATCSPIARGALPIEVNAALESLERAFRAELGGVSRDDPMRDDLATELRDFVRRELRDYISAIRPAGGVASIFQNARATTRRYDKTASGSSMMRCAVCGASRDSDAQTSCLFCGTAYYGGDPP